MVIVFAVKLFRRLYGEHSTLFKDYKPLLSIFGPHEGISVHSANRLVRWTTIRLGHDISIRYRGITEFGQADGLSRFVSQHLPDDESVIAHLTLEDDVSRHFADTVRSLPTSAANIR